MNGLYNEWANAKVIKYTNRPLAAVKLTVKLKTLENYATEKIEELRAFHNALVDFSMTFCFAVAK